MCCDVLCIWHLAACQTFAFLGLFSHVSPVTSCASRQNFFPLHCLMALPPSAPLPPPTNHHKGLIKTDWTP